MQLVFKNNNIACVKNDDQYIVSLINEINITDIKSALLEIYHTESTENCPQFFLSLRGLSTSQLSEAIRVSLEYSELSNATMLLNIFNLIKTYNTLDDSFFENTAVYFENIEMLLDVKLTLAAELKAFKKQISVYFLSLLFSYNKLSYTPTDTHIRLPNIYKNLLLSGDILSLSGILAASERFSTAECVYIEDGINILSTILLKNALGLELINSFFGDKHDNIE